MQSCFHVNIFLIDNITKSYPTKDNVDRDFHAVFGGDGIFMLINFLVTRELNYENIIINNELFYFIILLND